MKRYTIFIVVGLLMMGCTIWPCTARGDPRVGLRAGYTRAPDQWHFGIHLSVPLISHVRFQPNAEFGTGNDLTVVALNSELHYLIVDDWVVRPYLGGGIGLNMLRQKGQLPGHVPDMSFSRSSSVLFGIEIPLRESLFGESHNFMAELKVGVKSIPDFKLAFGVTF